MATFERTDKGFAEALASAKWMAGFHKKPFALLVPVTAPSTYVTSLPDLIGPELVEPGTAACLIDENGNMTPMFEAGEK